MEAFSRYVHQLMPLSKEGWECLQTALNKTSFKKGEYLLKAQQVCRHIFFIETGFCRSYHDRAGKEINTAFHFEGEMVTNIGSFGTGRRSDYNIQACEKLEVTTIEKDALLKAAKEMPELEVLGRHCIRAMAGRLEEQANVFQFYKPAERYKYIEERYPEMLQRVSLSELASYLGIARETLSRIRKRRL